MFKVGDWVTPDLEVLRKVGMPKDAEIWGMGLRRVYKTGTNSFGDSIDFEGEKQVGWLVRYWKLALPMEEVLKLVKKHGQ